jgi:hypothetical protein
MRMILTIYKCWVKKYKQFVNVNILTICKCEVKEYTQFVNVKNINNL